MYHSSAIADSHQVSVSPWQRFPPALHPPTSWRSMRMECRWSGNLWKPMSPSITLSSARAKVKWSAALMPCREHLDFYDFFTSWIFYFYWETASV